MIRKSLPEIFWKRLSDPRVIFLATSDKNQPKIRPLTLIGFERRLFVHSYKETAKIKQMKKNPRVEFCLLKMNPYNNPGLLSGVVDFPTYLKDLDILKDLQ